MIQYVVPRGHEFTIKNYQDRWAPALGERLRFLFYEELPSRNSLPAGCYIFSALDQLTETGTRLVLSLQAELDASGRARMLNRPGKVLHRLGLLERLHAEGLNPHRAVRANGSLEGLRYPVFLREEWWHTGSRTGLLQSRAELDRELGRAVLQGLKLEELLVVEFCDTADALGLYRKYSAFVVGREVVPRSIGVARQWMLKHGGVEFSEAMLLEERAYVFENPHASELLPIFELAGIEFGRIDYALKGGRVVTWEINTNPTIGPGPGLKIITPPELQAVRQPARDEFTRRFFAALDAVNLSSDGPEIPVRWAEQYDAAALVRVPPREGALVPLARRLGPLKRVFDPVVRLVAPLVAWVARRFR